MNNQKELSFTNSVLIHCAERKTGTVFISTHNNKSSQILIKDGEIVAAKTGRLQGNKAIFELESLGIKAVSFNEGMQLKYTEDAMIKSSDAVFNHFNFEMPESSSLEEENYFEDLEELVQKDVRMYRGQRIEEELAEPVKKKVRMYRGQVVED